MKAAASLLVLCFAGALATEALYNYTPTKVRARGRRRCCGAACSVAAAAGLLCAAPQGRQPHAPRPSTPQAGDWMPPNPPAKETPHLEGRVPAPSAQELSEVAQALGYESLSTGRKLLQDDAAAQTGGVVPHNWCVRSRGAAGPLRAADAACETAPVFAGFPRPR